MKTLLKVLIGVNVLLIMYLVYQIILWLMKDRVILVNKDNSLSFYTVNTKNKTFIVIDKKTYPLDSEAVHTTKGKLFWKKTYVFNENSSKPRKLTYIKDVQLSAESITKVMNDDAIQRLSKKAIDPGLQMMLILGAIGGLLASVASIVLLLRDLGIIK